LIFINDVVLSFIIFNKKHLFSNSQTGLS